MDVFICIMPARHSAARASHAYGPHDLDVAFMPTT